MSRRVKAAPKVGDPLRQGRLAQRGWPYDDFMTRSGAERPAGSRSSNLDIESFKSSNLDRFLALVIYLRSQIKPNLDHRHPRISEFFPRTRVQILVEAYRLKEGRS